MSVPTLIDGPVAPPLPPPGSKRKHRDEDTIMAQPTAAGAVVSQVGGVVPSPPAAPVPPSTQPTAPLAPMAPEPPQTGVAAAAVVAASPPMGVATGLPATGQVVSALPAYVSVPATAAGPQFRLCRSSTS